MFVFCDPLIYLFNLQLFSRATLSQSRALKLTQWMMLRFVFLLDLATLVGTKQSGEQWRHRVAYATGWDQSCTLCCADTCQKPLGFLLHKLLEVLENGVFSHTGFNFLFYYFYFTTALVFLQILWTQLEIHRVWLLIFSFTLDLGMASVHQLWFIRSMLLPDQWNNPMCLLGTVPPLNKVLSCTAGAYGCFISSFEALKL